MLEFLEKNLVCTSLNINKVSRTFENVKFGLCTKLSRNELKLNITYKWSKIVPLRQEAK